MAVKMHLDNVLATAELSSGITECQLSALKGIRKITVTEMGSYSYRLNDQMTTVQLFPSGKIVFNGSILGLLVESHIIVIDDLRRAGVVMNPLPELKIRNLVASGDFRKPLNLSKIALNLGLEKTEYEPEQFPSLVYRMDDPAAVILLFSTGKMVCTGVSSGEQILRAAEKVSSVIDGLC